MRVSKLTVVGIGASAGGLEAVAELLASLPAATGMAFIVVQHLDPRHESLLAEILAKKTTIPVSVALSGQLVTPDHVYVIPPDVTLTVVGGRINLRPRSSSIAPSLPVDILLKSLADAYGENAIAVVLSGGGADGSFGVQAVRQAGGITFAQTPEDAHFSDMPRHAIETGCVDVVSRPSEIAKELVRLGRQLSQAAAPPEQTTDLRAGANTDGASLSHIFQRLRSVHGVDFTHYKRTTILRRLERRMALRRIDGLEEYGEVIDADAGELAALYQDFLIRVTSFFRDPDSFDALRRYVFPTLFEGRSAQSSIRIWVPGCATGEEVYSVAIALLEYLGDTVPSTRIQLFGTDISEMSLQKARAGAYSTNALHEVSSERLQRFFTKENEEYRVAKELRALCLFARQDVTRDPPFSRLDLISCRNLLIYLDSMAQQRVLRTFHYALRPDGMLMFGPAETIGLSTDLFEQADKRFRAYRRLPNHGGRSNISIADLTDSSMFQSRTTDAALEFDTESLLREADRLLLGRFAPASLLINRSLTILQFRGDTGPYLEPAAGAPSFDLRRVVRPELQVHLIPAIEEASSRGAPARLNVRLEDGREVGIEIIPLTGSPNARSFLLLFEDASHRRLGKESAPPVSALPESEKDRRIAELEHDLASLRAYMRSTLEQHGTIQEELKSAQEEMLSANEEFQTTNEELETSKEELQSANEELTTTIDELRHRNQELAALNAEINHTRVAAERARSYAEIIIETVHQPLAVLDGAQRILRVNPAFSLHLGVPREEVEGRLLQEIDHGRWNIPEFGQRLLEVMSGAGAMEDWEVTRELEGHGRRVMSLTARRIPGDAARAELLLLAFEDVTARVDRADDLVARNVRKDEFLAMLGHELRHPLTPITHAVYLLRRGNLDAATTELVDMIDAETQRLLRFVDELLDVARISRGDIEVRHESVDLVSVARAAVRAVEPFIERRGHRLSQALPAGPLYVKGDAGRLNQVITNLLENAAKYTEPGGQIWLTLEQRNEDVILRVRDSGMGIDQEDLERVFEPFTRTRGAQAAGSGGLGLGLSLSRRVVELHGGHIAATSGGMGKGSEFVVGLPVLAPDAVVPRRQDPVGTPPRSFTTAHSRKVLIVDDHEELRDSLGRLVRSLGHEVALAQDGQSALMLAESFQPNAAILDISLEGMSGIELGRRLRERFPRDRLLMIALTGFVSAEIRKSCLAAGFDAHLIKPGEIPKLEQLLDAQRLVTEQIAP